MGWGRKERGCKPRGDRNGAAGSQQQVCWVRVREEWGRQTGKGTVCVMGTPYIKHLKTRLA